MVDEATVEELAARKLQTQFGVRSELRALPTLLSPEEQLVTMASGALEKRTGLLVLTDQRVIFIAKGMGRERVEEFPYSRISSVQAEQGIMLGKVTLWASGNSATLHNIAPRARAREIADAIRARTTTSLASVGPVAAAPAATLQAGDPLDQLAKLAALRDAGVLTEQEFQEQKARILGNT